MRKIYLAQCDSTVGFLSKNSKMINVIKKRDLNKKNILAISSFGVLKRLQETNINLINKSTQTHKNKKYKNLKIELFKNNTIPRMPQKHKNLLRRSKNTTFIVNKFSFRVIDKNSNHFSFIDKFKYMYSSSANKNNKVFDFKYAYSVCDVCVFSKNKLKQNKASKILLLTLNNKFTLRD